MHVLFIAAVLFGEKPSYFRASEQHETAARMCKPLTMKTSRTCSWLYYFDWCSFFLPGSLWYLYNLAIYCGTCVHFITTSTMYRFERFRV